MVIKVNSIQVQFYKPESSKVVYLSISRYQHVSGLANINITYEKIETKHQYTILLSFELFTSTVLTALILFNHSTIETFA